MPELPPPPDPSPPSPSSASALLVVVAHVRSWVASADGRVSVGRVVGAMGGALALVVVAVVGWRAFAAGGGGPPPELTMPRAGTADAPGDTAASGPGSRSSPSSASPPSSPVGVVVAHVAGAVTRPGLYRLGGAPRVADALDAAGGPAPDADLDAVNLAASVADGERVYVPRRGELPPSAVGAGASATTGPLDLNAATAEELEDLPGVGPSTAAAILEYRQRHGRFRSVDELLEVRGIGEARLAELRPKVRVR